MGVRLARADQVQHLVKETGAKIGEYIHSDALSARRGQAGSYIEMIRYITREIAAALMN
jgi:ABC-type Zn uptake system ZnuABC Zn-binding protein ZnuA